MPKIFIIEDDKKIREELSVFLSKYGYSCDYSDDFENITKIVLNSNSHAILLDINLPHYDGYHICKELRKQSNVPIMIVTSRNSDFDELMGMNFGADDFITKPYNPQILLARLTSLLRRTTQSSDQKVITHKDVSLNIAQSTINYNGKEVELTKNEFRILNLLMRNKGTIISRDEIMNELWQSDEFVDDNTLTVNINRLRKKLLFIGKEGFILTKRGQGYRV